MARKQLLTNLRKQILDSDPFYELLRLWHTWGDQPLFAPPVLSLTKVKWGAVVCVCVCVCVRRERERQRERERVCAFQIK